jgi:tRNA pseudouridine55 synthase
MDGILIIDKPVGLTSHDVVARVRRILKTKRVGHTGTLDPFATGVLVLMIGKATRLAQFLDKDEKEYEAEVRFGYETDTGDRTGVKSAEFGMRNAERDASDTGQNHLRKRVGETLPTLNAETIETALNKFRGRIQQVPPMYSAKKIAGRKLYELAREGKVVERKPVDVIISKLEIAKSGPSAVADGPSVINDRVTVSVACSAGTYIRTLAEDIGRELGVGAHLDELRRTRAGKFTIEQSITLDALEKLENPPDVLLQIGEAVSHLPELLLPADRVERTRNGLASRYTGDVPADGDPVRMTAPDGELVAVGVFDAGENIVQPKVVLV